MGAHMATNPISIQQLVNASEDAQDLEHYVNDDVPALIQTRLGGQKPNYVKFLSDREAEFQDFLLSSGYQDLGDYAAGMEITGRNQVFRRDGELWRASPSVDLPYTTTGDWGVEGGNFVSVGDAALRQELGAASGGDLVMVTGTGPGSITQPVSQKLDRIITAADVGAVGDGTDMTSAFSELELAPGRQVDLLGKVYTVTEMPNGNDYFNGAFKVGSQVYWRNRNPRQHPFENPAPVLADLLPNEGVYRGLSVGILPQTNSTQWVLIWREASGHGVENGTTIMAADTVDAGKTLTNVRLIYRTSNADTRNFVSGAMASGRVGVVAARAQEGGTYLPPVFLYSDNAGAMAESWSAVTLPASGSVDFHGELYPWPAAAGGHDSLGYIAYGYVPTAQGGGICAFTTVDNGMTWTEHLGVIPVTVQFANLSEISVTRIGNKNRWVAAVRTFSGQNMAAAVSSDMLTWSVVADSGLFMRNNPPCLFYEDGKVWLLSFSRSGREIVPEFGNAIVIAEGDAETIWQSGGQLGWKDWKIISPSTWWPTGYISVKSVRGRWYGLFTAAEEQPGNSAGRTAYLGLLSCDPVQSATSRQMQAVIPQPNSVFNGSLQAWQAGTSFSSFSQRAMVADGFTFARTGFASGATVSRVPGSKARYAMRVRRDDGDLSTAMMCLSCVLTVADSIPFRNKPVTLSLRLAAGSGFSAVGGLLGVQVRQTNNATEQQVTGASGLFSVGDSPVGSSGTVLRIDGLWRDLSLTVQNVAKDATQLLIRFSWTPVGTAANDYFDMEMLKMEPGRLATPFVFEPESVVLARASRHYQAKSVRTENGARHIPLLPMHRSPAVTVSAGAATAITRDGFELTYTADDDCVVVASAVM